MTKPRPERSPDRIVKELVFNHPRADVWNALATRDALAEWMYPNDFEARVGHRFSFHVPPKPEVGFEGLTVACEVITCDPPSELVFTWIAGGIDTTVRYRLEDDGPDGTGTRVFFEHAGFTVDQKHARMGAEYGWGMMHEQLAARLERRERAGA